MENHRGYKGVLYLKTLDKLKYLLDLYMDSPMSSKSASRISDLHQFFMTYTNQAINPLPDTKNQRAWIIGEYNMRKGLNDINISKLKRVVIPTKYDTNIREEGYIMLSSIVNHILVLQTKYSLDLVEDISKIATPVSHNFSSDIFDSK